MTIAGVGANRTMLNHKHGPVAVMLDLMNPVTAFGRLVGQAGKLWRDKAKAGHSCFFAGPARIATSLNVSRLGTVGTNSKRAGCFLVRNSRDRSPYSRDRSPCIGAAHSSPHPNHGVSIHGFRSNHTVCSRSLLVDSRKGMCRCSNFLNSRSFLLATRSVKLRAKV